VQDAAQLRYAALLDRLTWVGLVMLIGSFVLYVSGWLPSYLPPQRLVELWTLPVSEFVARSGMPTGWAWLGLAHRADMSGLLGIAVLAGCSVPCLLALVPSCLRRGDRAMAWLCVAEAAVVVVAASGLIQAGH